MSVSILLYVFSITVIAFLNIKWYNKDVINVRLVGPFSRLLLELSYFIVHGLTGQNPSAWFKMEKKIKAALTLQAKIIDFVHIIVYTDREQIEMLMLHITTYK